MNVKRLKRLVKVLENVIETNKGFNLRTWANADKACGTTCCAMGYAALDPVLRKDGLSLQVEIISKTIGEDVIGTPKSVKSFNTMILDAGGYQNIHEVQASPEYMGFDGFHAAIKFFDVEYSVAQKLFNLGSYRHGGNKKPQVVIDRINKLIASQPA